MKHLIVLLCSLALGTNVYAACQQTSVLTSEGKYLLCTTCCDSQNNCQVICV